MRSAPACVFCADLPSSSGSQYLKTMVEATTEHLRLTVSSLFVRSFHTNPWHMQHLPLLKHQSHSTTSAPKLSQSYPTYAPSRKIDVVTPEIYSCLLTGLIGTPKRCRWGSSKSDSAACTWRGLRTYLRGTR
jgi:hypothetical protein